MQPSPDHERYARALAAKPTGMIPQTVGYDLPPATRSFLSAIERIDDEGFARWTDTAWDDGEAYVMRTTENVHLVLESDGERVPHVLTADDAEARGWELIALAHLARGSSPLDASGSTEGRG